MDSLDYDLCKAAVLGAYKRVPEAHWQQFRNFKKGLPGRREKGEGSPLFDKWGMTSKFNNFASLREPILFEDIKKSAPGRCVVYFDEEKVSLLSEAALFADESMVFSPVWFPLS